jgi:hypothetical protein
MVMVKYEADFTNLGITLGKMETKDQYWSRGSGEDQGPILKMDNRSRSGGMIYPYF